MSKFFISSESNPDLNSPNFPINLDNSLIIQISKEDYPILEVMYPCIFFNGTNISWVYKNRTNRDNDYNKIIGIEEIPTEKKEVIKETKKVTKGK